MRVVKEFSFGFLVIALIGQSPVALAKKKAEERKAKIEESKIRDFVGLEGVQPGSSLRETEQEYRKRRHDQTTRSIRQLPGKAGIEEPRLDMVEGIEPIEVEKSRTDRTLNRVIKEVDPGTP